jgi:hypothetical protein
MTETRDRSERAEEVIDALTIEPIYWFNVNYVDETVRQALTQGTRRSMIPLRGNGGRIIGEITRHE